MKIEYKDLTNFIYSNLSWGPLFRDQNTDKNSVIKNLDTSAEKYITDSLEIMKIKVSELKNKKVFDIGTGRYLIVFNGEIYNTKNLIKYLPKIKLRGNSDTEILVNLYAKYKQKTLDMIEGMFSFVVYDIKEKQYFIARDRFGIKPLYFYQSKFNFIISSEIKPIINYTNYKDYNLTAFGDLFFSGSMDHSKHTFFNKINSLEPSHFMILNKEKIKKIKYWDLKKPEFINTADRKKKLYELILESINQHLISDRKIGLFLSGGTDGSALASTCKKNFDYNLDTYTYDFFDNQFGESKKSRNTANKLNLKNNIYNVAPDEVINEMNSLCEYMESPFTSVRLFGVNALYRKASEDGFKVIFEGHGGDEMNGGYGYNYFPYLVDQYGKKKLKKKLNKEDYDKCMLVLNHQSSCTSDGIKFTNFDLFNKDFARKYTKDKIEKNYEILNCLQNSQLKDIESIKLPRLLKYTDRLSMRHGIEARVPYLNHRLFNYCFHLRNEEKFFNSQSRYLFKNALFNIGSLVNFQKKKQSIVDPQKKWLKVNLRDFVYDNLNSSVIRNSEIFNHKKIIKYYENFVMRKTNTSFLIFIILTSISFLKVFNRK